MQFWCAIDPDSEKAKTRVARRMEGFYKLPFASFERYVPFGSARDVAEYITPYIEAGCAHVNLVLVQDSPEGVVEAAADVRQLLHAL